MTVQANFPSVLPSLLLDFANGKKLDPRVTFTRATTAAYYDDNTTAMAEQNLFTYSQEFDNAAWTKSNTTLTANTTTAPDGTSTADTLNGINGTEGYMYQQSSGVGLYTYSMYAKYNNKQWIWMEFYDNANYIAYFDVQNGVIGTVASGVTATITSVGSGWYRCTITRTVVSVINPNIGLAAANGNKVNTTGGSVYLWGAQLEQRSSATAYTVTTSQAITNYIPVLLTAGGGQPRFDHNPTTRESLGLLIEEQRTNSAIYSADFTNAAWVLEDISTVTGNVAVAPDGTLTADLVIPNTNSNDHSIYQNRTPASNQTFSLYAKAAGYNYVMLGYNNNADNEGVFFNLSNGTVSQNTSTLTPTITAVGNGWYRCSVAYTSGFSYLMVCVSANGTTRVFAGNGFSGVLLWGAQVESGLFPTSYIPTTSAAATRADENAYLIGDNFTSWFNNAEGTIYSDTKFVGLQPSAFPAMFALANSDPNTTNLGMGVNTATAAYFASGWLAGNIQFNINVGSGAAAGVSARNIMAYAVNDFAASSNAGTAGTASSGLVAQFDRFQIGGNVTYQPRLNAWYKKVAYYPKRVTNANLVALTS
jgi:hypothetical protein